MQDNEKKPALRFKGFTDPWEQRKISELAEKTYGGGTPTTSNEAFWNGNIPWIQSSDIVDGKLMGVEPRKYITQTGLNSSATQLVPKNSIAIITRVGVGKLAYMPFSYSTSQDFLSLSKLNTEPFFTVYACYKKLQSELNTVQGTSIKGITKDELLAKTISVPVYSEQKQIGSFFAQLDTLITLHQRKLEKLVQIRKAFAERCFLQSRKEFVMAFTKEADFEEAVVKLLIERGWKDGVLKNYTEQQLIQNWANILFENNRGIDRLNDYPLTDGEMQQIMEQVMNAKTPMKLNKFINGKSVLIKRDNPDDKLNFGKEVSLKIYDRLEIAAGLSRYQIAEQPKFPTKSKILNDRRGDLMLLINGMPVIHMELKKSGVSIKQACNQIEKYAAEGIFTGLFSLVQIFVAMNPEETVYFANPGPEGQFNPSYYFHWADFYNEPMNDWKDVTTALLSIPMAHMLVGFYTVADGSDGILKVMRSYQYYAASKISDAVSKAKWENDQQRGGYIWHTTGSGKTMTSFKSAQLIASSKDADKVIFLMDRIELGTQSLKEYRNFAEENEEVQATENTDVLVDKLKSTSPSDTLIVTSIQKMSNIKDDA